VTYSETILNLAYSLLENFNEVYHSAEIIVNDKDVRQPAINQSEEWVSLVPNDTKETLYIRRAGDDEAIDNFRVGSCITSYRMKSPLRVVYFKDRTDCHNEIISKLMQSVLISNTKLRAIIRNKWKLMKEESSGDYNFGPTTAYFAIDIYAIWDLVPDTCDEDFCTEIENPLLKTT
jgi:hypothetical protein